MDRTFDLVVIGSGSAGTTAAMAARKKDWSVAVIDERPFGGTCALRGCDPKKVLVAAARVIDDAERYELLGIVDRAPVLSWPKLNAFKRTFTDPVPEQRLRDYESSGIVALRGESHFEDVDALQVNGDRIQARRILIASGAKPRHVAAGDEQLLTSEGFLELENLPASLLFIGGGYVTFEFAHVAARAGAAVTILHSNAQPLRRFDSDVVEQLLSITQSIGIDVRLNTPAKAVERVDGGIVVHAGRETEKKEFRAQAGVLAAGRIPDIDHLRLETGGIASTERGVTVNEYLQSVSNSRVYAAGDASDGGGLPLTPVAAYEGEIVAHNLLEGNERSADFRGLASMVYTIPPLGATGLTEAAARERGLSYTIRAGDMTEWFSTQHVAGRKAYYKIVLDQEGKKVLGATILGPHAEEQINVLSLAVRNGLSIGQITDTLFAYPTGSSDLEYLLR